MSRAAILPFCARPRARCVVLPPRLLRFLRRLDAEQLQIVEAIAAAIACGHVGPATLSVPIPWARPELARELGRLNAAQLQIIEIMAAAILDARL